MSIGLQTALSSGESSLVNSQTQMAVVANNISKADQPGYHRQVAEVESNAPINSYNGVFGTGSSVVAINRSYNSALESNYRRSDSKNHYSQTYADTLSYVESLIAPNGTSPLDQAMQEFAASIQDVATTPESTSNRNAMLGEARSVADQINQQYESLRQVRDLYADSETGDGSLTSKVDALNQLTEQYACVNDQIAQLEADLFHDNTANDLRDERDSLLREIQNLIDVDIEELDDGRQSLFIGEFTLVDGTGYPESKNHSISVNMVSSESNPHGEPSLVWDDFKNMNVDVAPGFGEICALMDGREYVTDQMDQLYEYAETLSNVVNDVLTTGAYPAESSTAYDLNGDPGVPLFQCITNESLNQPSNGEIITVVLEKPDRIAASSVSGETGRGDIMVELWEAFNTPLEVDSSVSGETIMGFPNTMIGKIAIDTAIAVSSANTAASSHDMFQNAVLEGSGVNMDEEMTHMLDVQRSYQASAKLISVVNEMLDTALELV